MQRPYGAASHWEEERILRTVKSLIYFCDFRQTHTCLCLWTAGRARWSDTQALIGASLLMKLFGEMAGPRGHREDEP